MIRTGATTKKVMFPGCPLGMGAEQFDRRITTGITRSSKHHKIIVLANLGINESESPTNTRARLNDVVDEDISY